MQRKVIFRDFQKMVTSDLNNISGFTQETFDAVVSNAVSSLRYYTGFAVTKTGQTEITVAPGHYWGGGPIFVRAEPTVFNLLTGGKYMPNATKTIVAVVVNGETIDTDMQSRSFKQNQEGQTMPETVAMERLRYARVSLVPGIENPSPNRPTLDVGVIPIAWVTLTTAGVERVEMDEGYLLPSIESLNQLIDDINTWRSDIGQLINTILSELVRIQAAIPPDNTALILELIRRVGELENLAKQPPSALQTFIDRFGSLQDSDTAYAGYDAIVEDGLRFPRGTPSYSAIALNNPLDSRIKVTNNIMTPALTGTAARITIDNPDGALSISQYTPQITERVQKTISREVITYETAAHFIVSPATGRLDHSVGTVYDALRQTGMTTAQVSAWLETMYDAILLLDVKMTKAQKFQFRGPDGDTYDVSVIGTSVGFKATIKGLAKKSTVEETYWEEVTRDATATGSQVCQTFLNATNGWLSQVETHFDQVGTAADVQVFVVETRGDKPVNHAVLSRGTVPVASLQSNGKIKCQVEPVYLQGGRSYAVIWVTQGNHFLKVRSGNKYPTGAAFYLNELGEWLPVQNSGDICMSLYFMAFAQTRVEVQMQPLTREGGIAGIRINAAQHVPEGTSILWEIQRAGRYYQISEGEIGALDGNPTLVNLRAVFVGTRDLMPAIDMSQTEIELLGPVANLTHFSKERTLSAATSSIQVHYDILGYNKNEHTIGCSLVLAGGATETADSLTVTPDPQDSTSARVVAVFTPSAITSYRVKTTGNRGAATTGFVSTERRDFPF